MADPSQHPAGGTQSARRVTYGLNVLVAVVLVLALVVLLNWISNRQYFRKDFTATGQYSLSPQSRQVLKDLQEDYRIVTLFRAADDHAVRARDLVNEYARGSKHVSVQHIDIVTDTDQLQLFYTDLKDRYADQLKPMETAVSRGTEALDEVKKQQAAQVGDLATLLKNPGVGEGEAVSFTQRLANELSRLANEVDRAKEEIKTYLGGGGRLPSFTRARDQVADMLSERSKIYGVAIAGFERASVPQDTPAPLKEGMLAMLPKFRASQKTIDDALSVIQAAKPVDEYDQLSTQFSGGQNTVAVLGAKQVRVVPLVEMFREAAPRRAANHDEVQPELDFLGEERITGTLIAMSLKNPPLVVFLYGGGGQAAIGPGGMYEEVSQRLQKLGLKVDQWSPTGRPGPMGQMIPPGPLPRPAEGQRAVWIVLPFPPPSRFNPMAGGGEQVLPVIAERLNAGDSVFFILDYSPMASMGGASELTQMLEPWGVTPQLDRIVLQEITLDSRRKQPSNQHVITEWPTALPITVPLAGLNGVMLQGLPLTLKPNKEAGLEVSSLVEIRGNNLWAEKNLSEGADLKRDPATSADSFVVGAAVQSKTGRIVVISDPVWATDRIVTTGVLGPGTAQLTGAAFPANAELFVNSVLWLSNLDTLIAASAHTQDIRRVDPISPAAYNTLRWALLAGIPVAILLAGTGVWFVRRRG